MLWPCFMFQAYFNCLFFIILFVSIYSRYLLNLSNLDFQLVLLFVFNSHFQIDYVPIHFPRFHPPLNYLHQNIHLLDFLMCLFHLCHNTIQSHHQIHLSKIQHRFLPFLTTTHHTNFRKDYTKRHF